MHYFIKSIYKRLMLLFVLVLVINFSLHAREEAPESGESESVPVDRYIDIGVRRLAVGSEYPTRTTTHTSIQWNDFYISSAIAYAHRVEHYYYWGNLLNGGDIYNRDIVGAPFCRETLCKNRVKKFGPMVWIGAEYRIFDSEDWGDLFLGVSNLLTYSRELSVTELATQIDDKYYTDIQELPIRRSGSINDKIVRAPLMKVTYYGNPLSVGSLNISYHYEIGDRIGLIASLGFMDWRVNQKAAERVRVEVSPISYLHPENYDWEGYMIKDYIARQPVMRRLTYYSIQSYLGINYRLSLQ